MDRHGLVDAAGKVDWMRSWWRVWQVGGPASVLPGIDAPYLRGLLPCRCQHWRQPRRAFKSCGPSSVPCPGPCLQSNLDNNCEEGEEGNCKIVVS